MIEHRFNLIVLLLYPLGVFAFGCGGTLRAEGWELRGEKAPSPGFRLVNVLSSDQVPSKIDFLKPRDNLSSLQFDGKTSIAFGPNSNAKGLSANFTWEGFFLTPASNKFLPETGIADRLVTQFAFDKGNWTRLAIGLVADDKKRPRLSIELEGFDGRSFGLGDQAVAANRWHHFALVHEGTAAAATIRWYLDYKLTGEMFLGGQANQNTLRPPGSAVFAIGARLRSGDRVDRGFQGLIDEVRLTPRALTTSAFLKFAGSALNEVVDSQKNERSRRDAYWNQRHAWAKTQAEVWLGEANAQDSIDALVRPAGKSVSDEAFLRRLSLTIRGRIPNAEEVRNFLAERRSNKRARIIDQWLESSEWADSWIGYWQDVLAENPSVVFPTLNNSGAFRQWIYESFLGNKPFDRFATELMLMEPNGESGPKMDGPAGFALATGNDSPMAMRSHVLMKAFAAVDLKCARCHDSPVDDYRQSDLFLIAAHLNDGPLEVPRTSVAATGKFKERGIITTTLVSGQLVRPSGLQPFWLGQAKSQAEDSLMQAQPGPRGELAALITSPRNARFSNVIVNRVWHRYFGEGLLGSVDQWTTEMEAAHPKLLRQLSRRFVQNNYDLKWLAREILTSNTWQAERARRDKMSAEQLVDSLFSVAGKDFQAETLGVHATDPGAVQLPQPRRAWQFAALPNERDRPSLGMPVNQTIVDAMTTFGWNGNRIQPRSVRDSSTNSLQPLMISNGLMSQRITRLSEDSRITAYCLKELSVSDLVDQLFLSVLGRFPDAEERQDFADHLRPGFKTRMTHLPRHPFQPLSDFQPDWRRHLEAEQTRLMLAARKRVALGDPPTARLTQGFRERVEDVLWALINSPEFIIIP